MTYQPPFQAGQQIIELGGGSNPIPFGSHINVDCRTMPGVDVVADFNQPFPNHPALQTEQWDGLISKYAIEHISWRNVRTFIKESHRILKPGGIAVFITANLYEQAKKLAATEDWTDNFPETVFGSLDYSENAHKCGWSPKWAIQVFQECGFFDVKILPVEECVTDMIIEAYKSRARISRWKG